MIRTPSVLLLLLFAAALACGAGLDERTQRILGVDRPASPAYAYAALPTWDASASGPLQPESGEIRARFVRMHISAKRSSSENLLQLSEIKLTTTNGTVFAWPSGTSVSATMNGERVSTKSSETPAKLIDGNVSTKMCAQNGKNLPGVITIDLGASNTVDLATYSRWLWYTANDVENRDPTSFSFLASNDGVQWIELNEATNATITTTRRTLAYTGNLNVAAFRSGFFGYAPSDPLLPSSRNWYRSWLAATNPPAATPGPVVVDTLVLPIGLSSPLRDQTNTLVEVLVAEPPMLKGLVQRYRSGLAPTNIPVNLSHNPSQVVGSVSNLWWVEGEGVWARLLVSDTAASSHLHPSCEILGLRAQATDAWGTWGDFWLPWQIHAVSLVAKPALATPVIHPARTTLSPYPGIVR